jgi:hypothetical protein
MSSVLAPGRLCNQLISCLSLSILAKKNNLKVDYIVSDKIKDQIEKLGIELFTGENVYENQLYFKTNDFFDIYELDYLSKNLHTSDYFQSKEISNFLYNYINEEQQKNLIKSINKFKERYDSNNDCFIHIRLTDVAERNPGIEYYLKSISSLTFDTLYISSDDITHEIIHKILQTYPNTIVLNYDEVEIIHFGSTCKNIVLSHGSFSTVIGYLSFYSTVYYPAMNLQKVLWCPNIQCIPGWVEIGGDSL